MSVFRKAISPLCLIVSFLVLSACSERDSSTLTQDAPSERARSQAPVMGQVDSPSARGGTVLILPENPKTGDTLRAVVSGVGGRLSYQWEINDASVDGGSRASLSAEAFQKGDRVAVTVSVDGRQVRAKTLIHNALPEIVSLSVSPREFYRGIDVRVIAESHDADGDDINYSYLWLINGEEQFFETSQTLSGERFSRGDRLAVIVTPHDGDEAGRPFKSGELVVANAPPYFVSTPVPMAENSNTYRYAVQAVDPDGDSLEYSLEAAPPGMSIDARTGMIVWPITEAHRGENLIRIAVTDPQGAQSVQEFTMNLNFME